MPPKNDVFSTAHCWWAFWTNIRPFLFYHSFNIENYDWIGYFLLSNKRDVTLIYFGKFQTAQNKILPCTYIDFITELSIILQNFQYSYWNFNILTEPNSDVCHGRSRSFWATYVQTFILALKFTEKVQLIFNFCTPTRLF